MSGSLHFFTIPALDPEAVQGALNAFLAQQRVVALDRQFLARPLKWKRDA